MQDFILEFSNMKVVRFHLKKGDSVPLHLHNNQNGFAYLLEGKCKANCYQAKDMDANTVELTHAVEKVVDAHSHCVITPDVNAHTITALEDCIFLDCFSLCETSSCCCVYLEITNTDNGKIIAKKISMENADMPEYWYAKNTEVQKIS